MNDDSTWRSKANLVARGYEDKVRDRVSSDSPVAPSAAQRLALVLLAEKQWIPNSWDFTTAFLQDKFLTRDVLFMPPIDFVGSHVVWRLKKPIYGIVSTPKSWFDRLIEVCRADGLTAATTDECPLIMTSGEQVVEVLALHVDDAIGGGTEEFHGVMKSLVKLSPWGLMKPAISAIRAYACLQCSRMSKPCSKSTSTVTTAWLLVGLWTCHWAMTRICCRRSQ
jgi:Reverse transcriptase (RNA-dependent DNA polymerase)